MSVELPTSRPTIPLANYTRGRSVFADDWKTLAKANHFCFARTRSKIAGLVFEGNPWSTTSTSYVTADDNAGRDFATWTPIIELPRRHYVTGSGFRIEIECEIYGRNIDVDWNMIALDTNGNFAGVSHSDATINSASWQHASGSRTQTWGNAHIGGSTSNDLRQWLISPRARRNGFASTGDIWAITFYASILTAAQIPVSES